MDPAGEKADRYYDGWDEGLAAPAARDAEPGAHTKEDGPGPGLASHPQIDDGWDEARIAAEEADMLLEWRLYEDHPLEVLRQRMEWGNWLYWWGQANLGD